MVRPNVKKIIKKGANSMEPSNDNGRQTMPKRYSDEWFEMVHAWYADEWEMVQEYECFQQYNEVQGRLHEFDREVRHRIYGGG
jgi:hypothetical protein